MNEEQAKRIFASLFAIWCKEHGVKGRIEEDDTQTKTEAKTA